MQWRIWLLATAGKFFEGLIVFMTGVALPLIVAEFGLSATQKGIVGAATLAGIMVGAITFGGLADSYGRKRIFVIEMMILVAFLIALTLSPSYPWLVVFLFGVGIALGCDYPTAHLVVSESIPSKDRGKLVLSVFGFQALGALVGTAVGYLILANMPELGAWRWMYATAIIPAILVVIGRFFISDSAHWLLSQGHLAEAEREVKRLLARDPPYPKAVLLAPPRAGRHAAGGSRTTGSFRDLFSKKTRRATILASVPWFLQDLSSYGIGIFTPTILAATLGYQITHPHNITSLIARDIIAAKGAALLDCLLIFGIIAAVLLADRVGRIRLQIVGFIGCAIGLALAALSLDTMGPLHIILLFGGFMLFNFMTNLGPNSQTYLLAGEVFPTEIRGKGAGFAAGFSKMGAVTTAFLFPVLLADIGTGALLAILVCTSLLGAFLTWRFQIETTGVNLEEVQRS
jgi:MFS family permease